MKEILLVGISVRAAAQSAVRSGHPVMALDSFGDLDLSATCRNLSLMHDFPRCQDELDSATERLYRCTRELDFDEVIYLSGFENHPECVQGWETDGITVLGNSSETLRSVRDWEDIFAFLDKMEIPHPETFLVKDVTRLDTGQVDPRRYIVKPVHSGGGHGIRPLSDFLGAKPPEDRQPRPILIQELLKGIPASASFVSAPGEFRLISTTMQLTGNQFSPFRYCGNIAPLDAPPKIRAEMEMTAKTIAREYGLVGSNGIDFMLSGGRAHLLEVNPRPQGSLEVVESASDSSVMDSHIRSCRGCGVGKIKSSGRFFHGRKIVFSPSELVTTPLDSIDFVRDVPRPGTPMVPGAPICTVVARSESADGCRQSLGQLEKRVIRMILEPGPWKPSP
jgi:predicted ATP-grasp superfamily ATP-dependent carboligase